MTMRILNETQQRQVAWQFRNGLPISELVSYWGVSRRTIIRCLEQQGVDLGIKRRKRRTKAQILADQQERQGRLRLLEYSGLANVSREAVDALKRDFKAAETYMVVQPTPPSVMERVKQFARRVLSFYA